MACNVKTIQDRVRQVGFIQELEGDALVGTRTGQHSDCQRYRKNRGVSGRVFALRRGNVYLFSGYKLRKKRDAGTKMRVSA